MAVSEATGAAGAGVPPAGGAPGARAAGIAAPAGLGAPGTAGLAPGAPGMRLIGTTTLFAGMPALFGGALAPSSGALGVVRFGFCAGMPAGPAVPVGLLRFGSGVPEGCGAEG